jgi:outer membrane receptor protein involved in Fe transport
MLVAVATALSALPPPASADFYRFSIGPFNTVPRKFVDLDSLKRVEILRGPSSSVDGSDALGGVVTCITKDPADYLAGRAKPWYFSNRTHVWRTGIGPNTTAPQSPPAASIDRYTSPRPQRPVALKVEF